MSKVRLRDGTEVGHAELLDRVVGKGLKTLDEVLDMEIPEPDLINEEVNKIFRTVLSAKKDAAISAANLGLKADEQRFKQREESGIYKLLAAVIEKKKELHEGPPVIDAASI